MTDVEPTFSRKFQQTWMAEQLRGMYGQHGQSLIPRAFGVAPAHTWFTVAGVRGRFCQQWEWSKQNKVKLVHGEKRRGREKPPSVLPQFTIRDSSGLHGISAMQSMFQLWIWMKREGGLCGESCQKQIGFYFKATVSLLGLAVSKKFLNTSQGLAEPSLKPVPCTCSQGHSLSWKFWWDKKTGEEEMRQSFQIRKGVSFD